MTFIITTIMDLLSIAIAGLAYLIGRNYACLERDHLRKAFEEVVEHVKTTVNANANAVTTDSSIYPITRAPLI
jgi:hypothetical protein